MLNTSTLNFSRDGSGEFKRVVLQMEPLDIRDLTALQQKIKELVPELIETRQENIHLTLFHFGRPNSLYDDFLKYNQELSHVKFLDSLKILLFNLTSYKDDTKMELISKTITKINYPTEKGEPRFAYVLWFKKSQDLIRIRKRYLSEILKWITECGVSAEQMTDIFKNSSNLKYGLEHNYNPHTTLGTTNGIEQNKLTFPKKQITVSFGNVNFQNILIQ